MSKRSEKDVTDKSIVMSTANGDYSQKYGVNPDIGSASSMQNQFSDDYFENLFKDTDYWSLYMANPYRDVTYEKTFWDKIGLSNKYDDNVAANQKAYNEYNAALAQKMYDEKYSSPANQASLQREAGINPDLAGLPSASGSVSPMSNPASPAYSTEQPISQIQGAIGIVTTALGFVQSALQNHLTMDSLSLSNRIKEFQLFDSTEGMAKSFAFGMNFPLSVSSHDIDDFLESVVPLSGIKGRKSKQFLRNKVSNLISSPQYESEYYLHKRSTTRDRFDYNSDRSSQFFDDDDDYMMIALRGLRELQDLLLSDDIETRYSENKSKRDYNNSFSGTDRGTRDKENALYVNAVNRVMGTMLNQLYDNAIHGKLGSQLGYIILLKLLGGFN